MKYQAIRLVKRPALWITADVLETVTLETAILEENQNLFKQTHMSPDPAMSGDRSSYIPPLELDDIMRSSGVVTVVESGGNALFNWLPFRGEDQINRLVTR